MMTKLYIKSFFRDEKRQVVNKIAVSTVLICVATCCYDLLVVDSETFEFFIPNCSIKWLNAFELS